MARAARLAAIATWLALLAACAEPSPTAEADNPRAKRKPSYNRREIEEPSPGVFTGKDGAWTVYRSDRPPPEPPPTCEGDQACEPAPEEAGDGGE